MVEHLRGDGAGDVDQPGRVSLHLLSWGEETGEGERSNQFSLPIRPRSRSIGQFREEDESDGKRHRDGGALRWTIQGCDSPCKSAPARQKKPCL